MLGLSFYPSSAVSGGGLVLQVEDDEGEPAFVPACLFHVEDPHCSRYWELQEEEAGVVHLWPPSFFRDHYHEELSEDVAEVLEDYKHVLSLLKVETSE